MGNPLTIYLKTIEYIGFLREYKIFTVLLVLLIRQAFGPLYNTVLLGTVRYSTVRYLTVSSIRRFLEPVLGQFLKYSGAINKVRNVPY